MFTWLLALFISVCSLNEDPTAMPELYKIVTAEQWAASQDKADLRLGPFDEAFIHLCEADQIDRIVDKFFADQQRVWVLNLDAKKLPGRLVKESNPGGTTEYYHLYDGSIPLAAVRQASERQI